MISVSFTETDNELLPIIFYTCVCFPVSSDVGSNSSIRFSVPSRERNNITRDVVITTTNSLVCSRSSVNTAGQLQQYSSRPKLLTLCYA